MNLFHFDGFILYKDKWLGYSMSNLTFFFLFF